MNILEIVGEVATRTDFAGIVFLVSIAAIMVAYVVGWIGGNVG